MPGKRAQLLRYRQLLRARSALTSRTMAWNPDAALAVKEAAQGPGAAGAQVQRSPATVQTVPVGGGAQNSTKEKFSSVSQGPDV